MSDAAGSHINQTLICNSQNEACNLQLNSYENKDANSMGNLQLVNHHVWHLLDDVPRQIPHLYHTVYSQYWEHSWSEDFLLCSVVRTWALKTQTFDNLCMYAFPSISIIRQHWWEISSCITWVLYHRYTDIFQWALGISFPLCNKHLLVVMNDQFPSLQKYFFTNLSTAFCSQTDGCNKSAKKSSKQCNSWVFSLPPIHEHASKRLR